MFGRKEGNMRLWTLRSEYAWKQHQREGRITGDRKYVDPYFGEAYQWLMEQMAERIPGYSGGWPVWAYQAPKPDLRSHVWCHPLGEPNVRLELEVPDERVLLSDYDAWHVVLNKWHIELTEEEDREWEHRVEPYGFWQSDTRKCLPPELYRELIESWKLIFDLDTLAASPWTGGGTQYIQAVVEYVELSEVKKVTRYLGREKPETHVCRL
jgi:hypothetical protein